MSVSKSGNLRICCATLTHTKFAIANATFPLAAGFLATSLKKRFGDDVEVEVFKYPEDLNDYLVEEVPDIFLASDYIWTEDLSVQFAKRIKAVSPRTLVLIGGPNISKDENNQKTYLEENPWIDLFCVYEGEEAVCRLVQQYMALDLNISKLKQEPRASFLSVSSGELVVGPLMPRIGTKRRPDDDTEYLLRSLDDIPSPYLEGVFDKFFDNKLHPLIETNRGCPFSCSFCQQAESYFTPVATFGLDRIHDELHYIAHMMKKHSPDVHHMIIADPNFAMFKRDMQVCESIREVQDLTGWPRFIGCSTGKNQPDRILDAVSKLQPNSLRISNSMQSMNPETLVAIKRSNIDLGGYQKVQTEILRRGLRSMGDIILSLPEETRDTHFSAIRNMIDSGIQEFTSYQAMILKSTELELESARGKFGIKTKWRLVPRAVGQYAMLGEEIHTAEVEEIATWTDTLSEEDYFAARRLHLTTMIFHNSQLFDMVHQILKDNDIKISDFIVKCYERSTEADFPLREVFEAFIDETRAELFATREECYSFYVDPDAQERISQGEIGNNLLFRYLSTALVQNWDESVKVVVDALEDFGVCDDTELEDLREIHLAMVADISVRPIVREERLRIRSEKSIENLAKSYPSLDLDLKAGDEVVMSLEQTRYEMLLGVTTLYPNNPMGWALALCQGRIHLVARVPKRAQMSSHLVRRTNVCELKRAEG